MKLGTNIYNHRKRCGVTQEELAAELGVTATAVSKWEKGYTLPDVLMLCAIADYFDVTTDELLGRDKNWKYAVIAAESISLGEQIAAISKEYGIRAKEIFTNYEEASALTHEDSSIRFLIAAFYSGIYGGNSAANALVCVRPSDQEILDSIRCLFEQYLSKDGNSILHN